MSVQRDIHPDFKSPNVCAFLKNHGQASYSDQVDVIASRELENFEFYRDEIKFVGSRELQLPTFRKVRVDLFSVPQRRLIRTYEVVDAVQHALEIRINALLFLKRGLDARLRDVIVDAFRTNRPGVDPIDDIETTIIRAGVGVGDYQVDLSFELRRTAQPRVGRLNLDAFVQQMRDLRKSNPSQPVYTVEVKDRATEVCDLPESSFPDELVLPVNDVERAQRELEDEANRKRPAVCEHLILTDHRIGTVFQHYEWKWEWEVRPIRIGRCEIMRTRIPVFYSRIRKYALWGVVVTEPHIKKACEDALRRCLEEAAIETAALAIVTGGLGLYAAGAAFVSAFIGCIERYLAASVVCLVAELRLVTEISDWEEKVF